MTLRLCVIWLTHGAGPAFDHAARAIAGCMRAGDHIILADTQISEGTAARQGRFFAEEGFHESIGVTRILASGGTWENAADLALQSLFSLPDPPELIMLFGPDPSPDGAAFMRARTRMEEEEIDCLRLRWQEGSEGAADCLFSVMMRRDLLGAKRPAADGLPQVLWEISSRAQHIAAQDEPLGLAGVRPAPGPEFPKRLARLLDDDPQALVWAQPQLAGWVHQCGPAARSAWAAQWQTLTQGLPDPAEPPALWSPQIPLRRDPARIRLFRAGRHAHRTPFAYDTLHPLWEKCAKVVSSPSDADLIVFAHPNDPLTLDESTAAAIQSGARVALISEEPFWDSLFSPDPFASHIVLPAAQLGELRLAQINHHASAIFDWDHLPYYLISQEGMIPRLAERLKQTLPPGRETRVTFMAEKRSERFHDIDLPRGDLLGLCAWRTRLAEAVAAGPIARLGASWDGGPTRFDLKDWHDDKLDRLAGQTLILSGVENTHQPTYLSEKLFDAFACGAAPLYVAHEGHSIHRLGLPDGSWKNLAGMTSADAARAVDAWQPDQAAVEAARSALADRFTNTEAIQAEKDRIGRAIRSELAQIMSGSFGLQ